MSEMLEALRKCIAQEFGVTMTDTHLTVRGGHGVACFVLDRVVDWKSDECYMCSAPGPDLRTHKMKIDGVLDTEVRVCGDCRCPK